MLFKRFVSLYSNNDIIVVVDPETALPIIKKIQTRIYEAYHISDDDSVFKKHLSELENNYLSILSDFQFQIFKRLPMFAALGEKLGSLDELGKGKTVRELRAEIIRLVEAQKEAILKAANKKCIELRIAVMKMKIGR